MVSGDLCMQKSHIDSFFKVKTIVASEANPLIQTGAVEDTLRYGHN